MSMLVGRAIVFVWSQYDGAYIYISLESSIWEQERLMRDFQTKVQDPCPHITVNRLRHASGPVQFTLLPLHRWQPSCIFS